MGNIESKLLDDIAKLLCEWSDTFAKPLVDRAEERIKIYLEISSDKPPGSIRDSVRVEMSPFSNPPIGDLSEKEIIIKCSIEEMMKAFFKDYVIVWHDPNANSQENQQYIAQIRRFCEVLTFTEWKKACDYIRGSKAVCHVISSGTNGEVLVKEIFEQENVCNIYVFCGNKEYHSSWAKNYPKVSCIETHIQILINQIQQNLLEWYKKASSLNFNLPAFAAIFNDSDKSEMNHLHRYLKVLPNFKIREQAKNDLLNLSKAIYTDPNNQGLIANFETHYNEYNKDHTLRWYTLESFFYKVTNNCLRIATSDSIQYCRLALKDIEQAIKDQYQAKSKNFTGLLYRGAYLSGEEWSNLKENQDKEIEMHGFLSVSKDKNVALNFLRDPSKMVLITIIVPKGPNDEEQGFAEIEEYSQYPQEKEILFNVRSRFTVLEAENDYEYLEGKKCRHLVLLYGAQGFRRFMSEKNPVQEKLITNKENTLCVHCKRTPENLLFVSISEDRHYCKACIVYGVGPFLCIPMAGESHTVKIKGCPLMNSSQERTAFYGYKCEKCQAKKQKVYFVCTDCDAKKWCENCFGENLPCLEARHNIVLETSPFSFWCEKMSANELNHLNFQNNLVKGNNHIFQQANMYAENHKYEKAIEFYNLFIQQNEGKSKDIDLQIDLAISYNNIGEAYYQKGDYKKALEYHLKCLDIRKSILRGNDNHIAIADSYGHIGNIYNIQGEYKKALEYYFKALGIRKNIYGENHESMITPYTNIGVVYRDQGEYGKALEYHLKSLNLSESIYGEKHPSVASSNTNIGLVFHDQGEHKKGLEYYFKGLEIFKAIYGEKHPEVATSYNNIGSVYQEQEEYEKALEYLSKAVSISKAIYGEKHPEVATSYNNIGEVYRNQKEYTKALEFFMKALDIFKAVNGENHHFVATAFQNIGNVFNGQGEHKKALEYSLKSLNINKNVYGEKHHLVAASYNNIGEAYRNQKEYIKALEYYFKSLDINTTLYGDNHHSVATGYNNIGLTYNDRGEYKKALEYLLKALSISTSIYGEKHRDIATFNSNIGQAYKNQGENTKALEYYLKGLEISKSLYGENHLSVVMAYNNIGNIFYEQGEHNKAFEYFVKALDVYKSIHGENHQIVASSSFNIGQAYDTQGEYNKAAEYFLKSLNITKSLFGDNHPDIAAISDKLGGAYYQQGEYKKALEYFLKCLDISKSIYGEIHPQIAACYMNIATMYESLGEAEKALEYEAKFENLNQYLSGDAEGSETN